METTLIAAKGAKGPWAMIPALCMLALSFAASSAAAPPLAISSVSYWAYQIQDLSDPGAVDALLASHYDMLVLEPTRTDWSSDDRLFDTKAMVSVLKSSAASDGIHRKLVLAYVDIGEAEDWRWYWNWSTKWNCQGSPPGDWPAYIVACDPDGWGGNYPVAFWDAAWKDVVIYGSAQSSVPYGDYNSVIDEAIKDGFDGIYLDWVEAFENVDVVAAAASAGVDPAAEMIAFIGEMKAYASARAPGFLIVQQNAASLIAAAPGLTTLIDAVAQEAIWFDGGATDKWNDRSGYDQVNESALTSEYLGYLSQYAAAGLPIFDCEYALDSAGAAYFEASAQGFVPYVSRRSLSRLSTTPPPGYLAPLCDTAPASGCFAAAGGKARLKITNKSDDSRDRLDWKWKGGDAVAIEDFQNPATAFPNYRLCVYDASAASQPLLEAATVPAASCGSHSCWRVSGSAGYKYKDRTATPDGITRMELKAGAADRARLRVQAKGSALATPTLPLTAPVTVQLLVDDGVSSKCWQAVMSDYKKNEAELFRATGP